MGALRRKPAPELPILLARRPILLARLPILLARRRANDSTIRIAGSMSGRHHIVEACQWDC